MEYETFLDIAEKAARAGGDILKEYLVQPKEIEFKGEVDLVTVADRLSEDAIVGIISRAFPDHQILAEERTPKSSSSRYRWVIDPLDGTTNYAHGFPCFAISIAVEEAGRIVVGLVYDPLRDECFTAIKGQGAYLNGRAIRVSSIDKLDRALLATGFPYDRRKFVDDYLKPFRDFLIYAQEIRRPGAAAIDLCYLAAGRIDGFWEYKLHPWDVAAGSLMVTEAGGRVTDFSGHDYSIYGQETLASNGKIHEEMIQVLNIS